MNRARITAYTGSALVLALLSGAPAAWAQDTSATPVTCKDGTTSAHGGRGACRGHGGIDKSKSSSGGDSGSTAPAAASGSSAASSTGSSKAATPVTCKDGTTSPKGGRGACRGHGGIDKSASGSGSASS